MTSGGLLLHVAGVTFGYGRGPVLEDVTVTVRAGDFLGVVGPSGSGKTTLLLVGMGAVRPDAGAVHRRPGLRIGYVPQVDTVDWSFPVTVAECLLMARARVVSAPWGTRSERGRVNEVLERLGLAGLGNRHIRELSGGQQQRVFVARALVGDPDVVLLDEPTSGVDVKTRHDTLHLLADLNAGGLTVVLTTHDLNGMAAHLPRLVCLNRHVVAAGTPAEVLRPDVLERTYGAGLGVLDHGGMPVVVEQVGAPLRGWAGRG